MVFDTPGEPRGRIADRVSRSAVQSRGHAAARPDHTALLPGHTALLSGHAALLPDDAALLPDDAALLSDDAPDHVRRRRPRRSDATVEPEGEKN